MRSRLPAFFVSHGGGPWSYMDGPLRAAHTRLEAALVDMRRQIGGAPAAVLMISAHWEEAEFTLTAHPKPPMIYDYTGFPEHTYRIHYDAPGAPALAQRVGAIIEGAGMPARLDAERGFDHGAFTPLHVIYPDADVPVVQLSLKTGLDPATHLALGAALAPLREEGVLILGSGLSYHNLQEFFSPRGFLPSHQFDAWLDDTLVSATADVRAQRLIGWENAPAARAAHPRAEHLLPLMVAVGAAPGDAAVRCHHEADFLGGLAVSNYRFGPGATEARDEGRSGA